MANVTLLMPAKLTQFQTRGATYTSDVNSLVTLSTGTGWDVLDLMEMGGQLQSAATNAGTAGVGVTAVEFGDQWGHTTILTLGAGCVLPAITGGAALGVGTLIYTLPVGAQIIKSSRVKVAITQTAGHITADTPTIGLGTVIASGVVSVLSGTATFQNINVGKAAADCNGTPTIQTVKCTTSPFELVTETGGVKSIYLNAANTWAASGDPAAALSGTVVIDWKALSTS